MNKRISIGAALAILLIVAAVTFSMTMIYARNDFNRRVNDLREREREFEKYAEIDRLVRINYYGKINDAQLMDSVAKGYVQGIGDTYATYLSAEEYKKLTETDEGDNVGIGAIIEQAPDDFYLLVTQVYPESPSQVAGIEAGDLIVKIDDVDLTRENSKQMLESISGPQGTKITLVFRRGSEDKPADMTRRAVAIPTVESRLLEQAAPEEPLVGYIRIKDFGERTYDQFNRELRRLTDAGAKSLILDVRDNKGTTMKTATKILDKLLPDGILATATYKDGTTSVEAVSDANEINLPMTVLINGGTASAAELFAQAIRDFDKGRIVGATTVGKGVLQEYVRLSDGSAIQLTVAQYQPPSGISFNEIGVKPDFDVRLEEDWALLGDDLDTQLIKAKEVAIGMVAVDPGAAEASQTEESAAESSSSSEESASSSSSAPASSSSSSEESESSESSEEE